MKTKTRRGVAALAVAAMAGGILPFLAVGVASASPLIPASEPTSVSVAQSGVYVAQDGSGVFTVNLVGAYTPAKGVYFTVAADGPDKATTPNLGTSCGIGTGASKTTFTCTVPNGGIAGIDHIRFFYDGSGSHSYVSTDVSVMGTLTIGDAGAVNSVVLSPGSGHAGKNGYTKYTAAVTDTSGRPVTGINVGVAPSASSLPAGAVAADYDVQLTDPHAQLAGTAAGNGGVHTDAMPPIVTAPGGVASFYVAGDVLGTITLVATATNAPSAQGTGTFTVNSAAANDATSVVITPATQKVFNSSGTAAVTIVVKNAQGDPIVGVTPVVTVVGPDAGTGSYSDANPFATENAHGTDSAGSTTATYTIGATAVGSDAVTAWVNQLKSTQSNTYGHDTGEPSGAATVNVSSEPTLANAFKLNQPAAVTVPIPMTNAPITFNLSSASADASGYVVNFTFHGAVDTKYSLSAPSAVTDSHGNVTATIVDSAPSQDDSVSVTATLAADPSIQNASPVVATWTDHSVAGLAIIAPFAKTSPIHTSTTFNATLKDQAGNPMTNITWNWTTTANSNNPSLTGTGASFTYVDAGATSGGSDVITAVAKDASGNPVGQDTVNQYWVVGTAQAAQAAADLATSPGLAAFSPATPNNGPYVPVNFSASITAGVSSDPTVAAPISSSASLVKVRVQVIDTNGVNLFGKSVTFTSSGVGGLTDSNGKPLQNSSSTTALVSDGNSSANGEGSGGISGAGVNGAYQNFATAYVRSTAVGTQTIVATVDGITNTATVTYTGQYLPLSTPLRVLDTRSGQGGLDNTNGSTAGLTGGKLSPNVVYTFNYANTTIPLDQAAYAFNVTAISPSGPGNLRVVNLCDAANGVPATSLINYQAGKDVANFSVIANAGEDAHCNKLAVYSDQASVAVAIDLVGYYATSASVTGIASTRFVDTRTGLGGGTGKLLAGTSRSFQIATSPTSTIPLTATAVALNVTAIGPQGLGNLRVYADGAAVPNASNINYIKGVDKAAFVIVQLPANGKIDVYSDQVAVDVAIDAYAYFPSGSKTVAITPTRVLDTRTTGGTLAANTVRNITVGGVNGIPADAQAVLVSITSIHAASSTGFGNLRVYAAGATFPNASNLNYVSKTSDVANFAIVRLSPAGQVSLYSSVSAIDVALDVVGYIPAGS